MVKNTGVALCNTMKIENRIKRNQQIGIKELGDFCLQYGYEKITPPSTSKRKTLRKQKFRAKTPNKIEQTKKWTPRRNVKKPPPNTNKTGNPTTDKSKIVNIPTKAKPVQMNKEILEHCKKEIQGFLDKKLIRPSKSPWSCDFS